MFTFTSIIDVVGRKWTTEDSKQVVDTPKKDTGGVGVRSVVGDGEAANSGKAGDRGRAG